MKKHNIAFLALLALLFVIPSCSQKSQEQSNKTKKVSFQWVTLTKGAEFCEVDAPKKSFIGDSKITILKIDPKQFDFFLLTATQFNNTPRTVVEWADSFNLNIVLNAGMYDLANGLINRGYMKNYDHCNNPEILPSYNSMIVMNPIDTTNHDFAILDLECDNWDSVKGDYYCYAQGMRMIDCNGQALSWNKKKQSCSMLIAATDDQGNIYYIFSRSPYTHNEMINFILGFPFGLKNAIYLEGGPETSLYIKIGEKVIERVGSYVSQTYPNDDNHEFWKLPNVIGMRVKE